MTRYVGRRLLLSIAVLLGVTLLTFGLTRGVGDIDPIVLYISLDTPPERFDEIRERHGLNEPLHIQYGVYLRDLVEGDLGYSRTSSAPVTTSLVEFLPATLELALVAFVLAAGIGVPVGVWAAYREHRLPDNLARTGGLLAVSTPSFWFGLMTQIVFFFWLQQRGLPYLPSGGRISTATALEATRLGDITGLLLIDSLVIGRLDLFVGSISHLVLPAVTLALFPMGLIFSVTRANTLTVLRREYIEFARSKGIRGWRFTRRHVLKNALIPVVTTLGFVFGRLAGGSVIVETVFSWPGMGRWAARSILNQDIASVMGFTIVVSAAFVFVNLVVDVIYAYLDPRIQY